jgi:hypothetical protein
MHIIPPVPPFVNGQKGRLYGQKGNRIINCFDNPEFPFAAHAADGRCRTLALQLVRMPEAICFFRK